MASTIIAEVSRLDLQELSSPPLASITGVKQLSSYNWIEALVPTIAVPGSPSLWSAPKLPRPLKQDSGLIYIAQNAARHPDSPLESLFRAVYIANPSFDIHSIDVVTDRNNIRKLLSFINPSSTRNGLEPFTINIEVTKNTAIFSRHETVTQEFVGPDKFRGYGHEFEKAYTISQISGDSGHHRIISYRFSDLNFVVRYETDGYVDTDKKISMKSKEPDNDVLSSMLGFLSLSSSEKPSNITTAGSKLVIKKEGQLVPLTSTLEIKTRVLHKPLSFQEIAPQLWVSQTPKLVRAYHIRGVFQEPEVEDVAALLKGWEERNQKDLKKLAALIQKILDVVRGYGGSFVVKYEVKGDKLVVRKVDGKKVLPKDLYSKWDDEDKSDVETHTDHDAAANKNAKKPFDGVETKAEGESVVLGPEDTKGKAKAQPLRQSLDQ